jgi:subtilisin-like proprotein convertase family protein
METIRRTSEAWLVGVIVAIGAVAVPAAAHAETLVNNGGGAVTIASQAIGSPYPSVLKVDGGDGDIQDVNVRVTLTHTAPDDIDLAIVSPDGVAEVLMTDACGAGPGTPISNVAITFDQQAGTSLTDDGPCATGTFKPTDIDIGEGSPDNFVAPGPGASVDHNLDTMNGDDPNGDWRLFVLDDNVGDSGSIASWGLTITTATAEVIVPANGTSGVANHYPAVKNVPTPDGEVISDVSIGIGSFNHTFPADLDMLLQGPGGQSVMLMSDACSDGDFHGRQTLFSDAGDLPTETNSGVCLLNFLLHPVDFGTPEEDLPAPAPPRPYATSLSVFDGLPAGDWRLWVSDDTNGDTGYLDGWGPDLTTRPAADTGFAAATVATAEGQTAALTVTRTAPSTLGPAIVDIDIGHSGTDSADIGAVPTRIQFARDEASKTIQIPIIEDFEGEGAEDFVVSLTNPSGDAGIPDAGSFSVVTIAASPPDNRFTVGEVKRLPNGSATVEVTIPNPGTLASDDSGSKDQLKPIETDVSNAGKSVIKVKPAKSTKRKLRKGKKVKLTAEITYKPYDGLANSAEVEVKLKRKP